MVSIYLEMLEAWQMTELTTDRPGFSFYDFFWLHEEFWSFWVRHFQAISNIFFEEFLFLNLWIVSFTNFASVVAESLFNFL